jgi:transcriptional regulator with XRE-family HTH domain
LILSQRALAEATGISQPTLSRIVSGDRSAKMPEIFAISWATGHTVAQLTGAGTVAERVQCAARAVSPQTIATLRGIPLQAAEAELQDAGVVPVTREPAWVDSAWIPDVEVDLAALDAALDATDYPDGPTGAP